MKLKSIPKIKIGFLKNIPFSKFPHFLRVFPARLFVLGLQTTLWLFLYLCLLFNLLNNYLVKTDEEKTLRLSIMKNPKEARFHEKLGEYYLSINKEEAEKEYTLAQEYYLLSEPQKNNVLGVQTSPWERWTEIATKREKLKQQVEYWEKIHRRLPNYLFAITKLTTLNYQLGDKEKAKDYLEIASKEDPVNQIALEMAERLK